MAKRSLKIFGMGIGGLLVVAGIIVGILFATGVIKVPSKNAPEDSSDSTPRDPLGPNVPNPYEGKEVNTTLSNPKVIWQSGSINIPSGIQFNVYYNPSPFVITESWILNEHVTLTFEDGTTNTFTLNKIGIFYIDTVLFEPFMRQFGRTRLPVKVEVNANLSYQNKYGNTINGPASNTVSVNIPTKY